MAATVADEFGEIDGDIRHIRDGDRYFPAKPGSGRHPRRGGDEAKGESTQYRSTVIQKTDADWPDSASNLDRYR
jgi:hypothetical protein